MAEIQTRAKFGDKKQVKLSQTTADNAPELDVKEQSTSNEVNKPDAQNQREMKDTPERKSLFKLTGQAGN